MLDGRTNAEIAAVLGVRAGIAASHTRRVIAKLERLERHALRQKAEAMTTWSGPYLAAMLLTSPAFPDPVDTIETAASTTRRITGIVTHAAVARLGEPVAINVLLIVFAGGAPANPLTISVLDPTGFSKALPPVPIAWNGPAEVTRYVLPLVIIVQTAGTYWVRAQIRHRMLSRVPLTIEVLPANSAPFLRLAD